MTDVLRFVFLELGRFRKRIWELENTFDRWMYLLKHMHEMVEIPGQHTDDLRDEIRSFGTGRVPLLIVGTTKPEADAPG